MTFVVNQDGAIYRKNLGIDYRKGGRRKSRASRPTTPGRRES